MISLFISNGNASEVLDCKDGSKVKVTVDNLKLKVRQSNGA
jgi:hypothetical protein